MELAKNINNSYINLYTMVKSILHWPRLDTVLMVEQFIKDHGGEYKKKSLWSHLPKKVMYQTYCVIFDYLLENHKIAVDRVGKVCWIYNPEMVRRYLKRKDLSWSNEMRD